MEEGRLDDSGIPTPEPDRLERGARVGDFEVDRFGWQEGVTQMYVARDTVKHQRVRLYVLDPPAGMPRGIIERIFTAEAKALERVESQYISKMRSCGTHEGRVYWATEPPPMQRLSDEMSVSAPARLERIWPLLSQVCDGLVAAHRADVVHGALTPDCICIDQERWNVLIGGFAVAYAVPREKVAESKSPYLAPEWLSFVEGEAPPSKPATDVFSLCAIIYEWLTARRYFARRGERLPSGFVERMQETKGRVVPMVEHDHVKIDEGVAAAIEAGLSFERSRRPRLAAIQRALVRAQRK